MRTIVEPSEADVVQSEEELLRAAPRPHERVVYWGSGSPQGTHCRLLQRNVDPEMLMDVL